EPAGTLGYEKPGDTKQNKGADLTRLQDEQRRKERESKNPRDPAPRWQSAVFDPQAIRATDYENQGDGQPEELRDAGSRRVEQAERHCQGERPRRVPHHHRLVGVAPGALLEVQKKVAVVGILAERVEPAGRVILHEIVGWEEGRVGEQVPHLPA